MSIFVAEAAARDALVGCSVFRAALGGRYPNARRIASRFTSALSLNCYARATVQGAFGQGRPHSQRRYLEASKRKGRAEACLRLKDHRLNGMLNRRSSPSRCYVSSNLVNG